MAKPPYPIPFDENYRLRVLEELSILDSEPEPEFDRLVWLATRHFGTKFAVISLIDAQRQWFKAICGLDAAETPREDAFCAHAIIGNEMLVVLDATKDKRFDTNPLVTGPPHIRFYAGKPLTVNGTAIGTLCVIDDKPRDAFGPEDAESLSAFAKIAEDELSLRAYTRKATEALSEQVREARRLADAGETAKAQFLALMSHELRTPLNAVIGFADCIAREMMGPVEPVQYREFAERIAIGGRRQLGLVERLLELTSRGRVEVEEETIHLQPLLERCVELAAGEAMIAGVTIANTMPDEPVSIRADRVHVEQMLLELIGNAIKFTPRDGQVALALARDAENAVTIAVTDTGDGIADEAMDEALAVFGRIATEDGQRPGGIGIGLPIVKKLAELHGAALTLSTPAGGGTRAEISFPAYRSVGP
ncbi:MAG: GAF domain-containing sensor histidine kinase [Gammaproteobacteria bacterium]|jgi:signal transduction histidine kinase